MRSRFTTITILLSNEHAPPLTCGLSVYSLFRVAVISSVAEKSTTTLNIVKGISFYRNCGAASVGE